jgi:hypothetical protein
VIVDSTEFLDLVRRRPEHVFLIHYSSESLFDDPNADRLSPRITSIAVMHLSSRQTIRFSTHTVAEDLKIPRGQITQEFDRVEARLLERFYEFIRDRREKHWVHWNMKNIVYGFEHIEQRYRTLTQKEPPAIPVEVRISLNDILRDRYGSDYAGNPKMLSLVLLNGERDQRFMIGKEEAEAFKNHEFIRMHNSTICKVEFFGHVVQLMRKGKLIVSSRQLVVMIDRMLDSQKARITLFFVSIAGGVGTIGQILFALFP